jgi:Transposase DDE domain
MRALQILQERLGIALDFMHAKRTAAFWRAVEGLLEGQRLWLTALGRSLPGTCSDKHRIKAVDRLLGSAAIQLAMVDLYAALAKLLLRRIQRPVILVDWTGADPGFGVLSATLCFRGRALVLFSRTFPKNRKSSPRAEREFLEDLVRVIPKSSKPIIATDAGFLFAWFDAVRACGWDYIGRLRGKTLCLHLEQQWMRLPDVHTLARRKPRDLGSVVVGRTLLREERIVLSAIPKLKGRKKIGRNGLPRRSTADRQRRSAAREPWVLVTSLSDPARVVVEAYRMRMQIEETFRDVKSHRYGWSAEDIRSKNAKRVDVILLVGAFAAVAMHIIGLAAGASDLQRGFQANTLRSRPVFSTFFLAKLTIARGYDALLPFPLLHDAARKLKTLVAAASLHPRPNPA